MVLIFSFIVCGTGIVHGEQLVPKTLSELYQEYQGKLVITGQILSVSEIPQKNLISYDVKIQNYITRPQQGSVITAVSPKNDSNPIFNVNDKVQLYLDKNSAGYVISPYSFKMSGSCSSFGPSYADFGPLSGGAAASVPFRFTGSQGNTVSPIVSQPNHMSYDVFNDLPLNKTTVELNITLDGNPVPVFHDTKYLDLKPCTGTTLTWNFVPPQMGNYTATVKQIFGIYDNKIILGNYTLANYGFSPSQTSADNSLLSPLEQFRSGTLAQNIKCAQGFELIIKSEDGSPACVKHDTAQKLIERGWTKEIVTMNQTSLNQNSNSSRTLTNLISDLGNNTGIVNWKNQKYYFETPNYTNDAYLHPVQISIHDVTFTLFPSGFRRGLPIPCTNNPESFQYYWTDVKFADDSHELLHVLADSPTCPANPIPAMFSNHANPQAGLVFYGGKMKLLVGITTTSSKGN
jgi:hypothetical protein